jgi:hypothetical protein
MMVFRWKRYEAANRNLLDAGGPHAGAPGVPQKDPARRAACRVFYFLILTNAA